MYKFIREREKVLRKDNLHEKIVALVLRKLFINGNEKCPTTNTP